MSTTPQPVPPDSAQHPHLSHWKPWTLHRSGQHSASEFIARQEVETQVRWRQLAGLRTYLTDVRKEPPECVEWCLGRFAACLDILGPQTVYTNVPPGAYEGIENLLAQYERRESAWREWMIVAWCDLWHATNDVDD